MSTSQAQSLRYLLGMLPPGIEKLWDLEPGGDFYKIFDAGAAVLKAAGFDLLDKLLYEQFPSQVIDKLPDWEKFLGVARFFIARFGTTTQRQAAVVSKIRERGAFIDTLVQAVLAPLLGYATSTPLEVMRASRSEIRIANTYTTGPSLTSIPNSSSTMISVKVRDGGKVAKMGARLILEFGAGGPYSGTLTVEAPDGTTLSFPIVNADSAGLTCFYAPGFAGASINGYWQITVANTTGSTMPVIVSIFVEGIARDQNTGGAAAHWGVYADPAHVGEQGFSDIEAVLASIERIKHSHDVGSLILSKVPYPGVTSGVHAAIPGMCIPSAAH